MNNKSLKRTLLMLLVCMGGFQLYAQFKQPMINLEHFDERHYQWGYYFGANTFDFKIDYNELNYGVDRLKEVLTERKIGFNVGLTGSMRLVTSVCLLFLVLVKLVIGSAMHNLLIYTYLCC